MLRIVPGRRPPPRFLHITDAEKILSEWDEEEGSNEERKPAECPKKKTVCLELAIRTCYDEEGET
jgi:hypothetical protein